MENYLGEGKEKGKGKDSTRLLDECMVKGNGVKFTLQLHSRVFIKIKGYKY